MQPQGKYMQKRITPFLSIFLLMERLTPSCILVVSSCSCCSSFWLFIFCPDRHCMSLFLKLLCFTKVLIPLELFQRFLTWNHVFFNIYRKYHKHLYLVTFALIPQNKLWINMSVWIHWQGIVLKAIWRWHPSCAAEQPLIEKDVYKSSQLKIATCLERPYVLDQSVERLPSTNIQMRSQMKNIRKLIITFLWVHFLWTSPCRHSLTTFTYF